MNIYHIRYISELQFPQWVAQKDWSDSVLTTLRLAIVPWHNLAEVLRPKFISSGGWMKPMRSDRLKLN
jgi:hypothetical protein